MYHDLRRSPSVLGLLAAATLACGTPVDIPSSPSTPMPNFSSITAAQWDSLTQRRIVFGHQSVGRNILTGVKTVLAANPGIALRVVQGAPTDDSPGLYHEDVGQNGDPASKSTHLAALVDSAHVDAALVKFCYVDVTEVTDADSLFANYQSWVAALQQRHPDLRIVHATLPLTSLDGRREWLMGKLKGRKTARDLNLTRHRYNEMLRREYVGRAPVFDIAALESTRADGSRITFRYRGVDVPTLDPEITDDGGHLNATGQRRAAEAFLALLASSL